MTLAETVTQVTERLEPARDRLEGTLAPARERVLETTERVREAAEPAVARAREAAEPAVARAREAAEEGARSLSDWLPGFLARFVDLLRSLVGQVEERGREVAARVEPPRSVKRRRALRTAGYVAGGFGVGVAIGWVARARYAQRALESELFDEPPADSEEADDSFADARRRRAAHN